MGQFDPDEIPTSGTVPGSTLASEIKSAILAQQSKNSGVDAPEYEGMPAGTNWLKPVGSPVGASYEWYVFDGVSTWQIVGTFSGGAFSPAGVAAPALPKGYLQGFKFTHNGSDATNDIDIPAGVARDDTDAVNIANTSTLTKQTDAVWAEGNNAGLMQVARANGTNYGMYAIVKADGTFDARAVPVGTALTLPAGFVYSALLYYFRTGTATVKPMDQYGDHFIFRTGILDVSVTNLSTTRTAYATSVPPNCRGLFRGYGFRSAAASQIAIFEPNEADGAPAINAIPLGDLYNQTTAEGDFQNMERMVDASSQILARSTGSSTVLRLLTRGFVHPRGRIP